MKKIIDGKKYNTETATYLGRYDYGYPRDFSHYKEELYIKRTGEYFLYGDGGASSKYSRAVAQNEWCGSEDIIPMTYEEARRWAEKHLEADEYEKIFGEAPEGGEKMQLSISIDGALAAALRKEASQAGITLSDLIERKLSGR